MHILVGRNMLILIPVSWVYSFGGSLIVGPVEMSQRVMVLCAYHTATTGDYTYHYGGREYGNANYSGIFADDYNNPGQPALSSLDLS